MIKEYKNSFRLANDRIKTMLCDRLGILGVIRADDAWQICRKDGYSYGVVLLHFKCIMNAMKDDGRSRQVCNGTWLIISKRPTKEPEKKLTLDELRYIFENRLHLTTGEIATDLNVIEDQVIMACINYRWKYKLKKEEVRTTGRVKKTIFSREEPQEQPKKMERHKGVYTNSRSPYGIADELHKHKNF